VGERRRSSRSGKLELTTPTGERLTIDGKRADVLAALAVRMLQKEGLETSDVWDVAVHVTRGQVVVRWGDTDQPYKFREAG
jgi:hypothetical protein